MDISTYFRNYFKKKSLLSIISDFVLIILILLIVIPYTRKNTIALLIRPTLVFKRASIKSDLKDLKSNSYNWKLEGVNTGDLLLKNSIDKDKPLFINIWATWCPPCIAEMPSIQKLYNEYKNDIQFLIISNEDLEIVKEFIAKNEYTFPVYGTESFPAFVTSNVLPTTYLIVDGSIILTKKGATNWNSAKFKEELDELLKNP